MTDYVSFEGRIDAMEWGKATYCVLRLPADVLAQLGGAKRVEGEFNDHPVNLAITTAPVIDGAFLWAGKSLQTRIGLSVGQTVEVRLRAADPNHVDTPDDVLAALYAAGKSTEWDALSAGKRRGILYQIETAKRAETHVKPIAKLVDDL